MELEAISQIEFVLRLIIAAILGGIIGIERETAHKPAGLRTYVLVSLGSALFTLTAMEAYVNQFNVGEYNPLLIAGDILVGVGFIGGGVIMHQRNNVQNITTAASIWIAAGIGIAVAFGNYLASGVAVIIAVATLLGLGGMRSDE
jgi:putative Mg2+ transporter-C (MgtC) family protein